MNIESVTVLNQYGYSFRGKSSCRLNPISDVFVRQVIDIGSNQEYPAGILSNFTESSFVLDGKQINSMEGFLQSLKTSDQEEQESVCKLVGYQAKKMSHKFKKRPGFTLDKVYWNGKEYDRKSIEFQKLLRKAFEAKYDSNEEFRKALDATKGKKMTHSFGKKSVEETILTEKEFVDILRYLKYNYKYKRLLSNIFGFNKQK